MEIAGTISRRSICTFLQTRRRCVVVSDNLALSWSDSDGSSFTRRNSRSFSRDKFTRRVRSRYIFLAKSHTNPSCGFYAGNDSRRHAIMRINHSDKRQPLLPILLPQSCPDFGSQLINQIIIIIIFVSPQQFSGFLNHVSSEQTWSALYNYAVKLRRDVVIRCNVIVPTIVSLRVTAVRMFLHSRLIDVDLISRRTSL